MKTFHLVSVEGCWILKAEKPGTEGISFAKGTTKRKAIKESREYCINYYVDNVVAVSLRIHNRDGRIQSERTYPRSADPNRSKG